MLAKIPITAITTSNSINQTNRLGQSSLFRGTRRRSKRRRRIEFSVAFQRDGIRGRRYLASGAAKGRASKRRSFPKSGSLAGQSWKFRGPSLFPFFGGGKNFVVFCGWGFFCGGFFLLFFFVQIVVNLVALVANFALP